MSAGSQPVVVVGAGNVGLALGTNLARHGHEVSFAVRDPGAALPAGTRALPVAADDAEARSLVAELASELGFDAVEVGGLEHAGLLEEAARYWGLLAFTGGRGRSVVLVAHQR